MKKNKKELTTKASRPACSKICSSVILYNDMTQPKKDFES